MHARQAVVVYPPPVTDHASPDDLMRGLSFLPLPSGWTPVDAIVMVKCIDEEGHPTWAYRTTESINDEELLGALTVRLELQKQKVLQDYVDPDTE
jgi:hypothetical protein